MNSQVQSRRPQMDPVRARHTAGPHHRCLAARPPHAPRITAVPGRSQRSIAPLPATASGGGAIGGGSNYVGGGSGSGSGGSAPGGGAGEQPEENKVQPVAAGGIWKGWQDRVAYDPEFPFKVFLEQVLGVGASVLGDMASRPNWGLSELDFVFCTLVVGSIINFSIMYLLAPTAATAVAGAASGNVLSRLMSEEVLRGWGAPGGNMFEPGKFTAAQRLTNFAYKGGLFASIGMFAGLVGTGISNTLLLVRQGLDPGFETQNTPPNVLANAGTWALHMALSTNIRYQILNGSDLVISKMMPSAAFRTYATIIRTANNIVGGMSFATLAKILGVQKSAEPEMEALPA